MYHFHSIIWRDVILNIPAFTISQSAYLIWLHSALACLINNLYDLHNHDNQCKILFP